MDPHALLGVPEGASPEEVTRAFRHAARRWHPDVNTTSEAPARMAELNAAYELLRAGLWQRRRRGPRAEGARRRRAAPGEHLDEAIRRALGAELVRAVSPGEEVLLVTPAATWASPSSLLALTDRRLLWLLDDVPTNRVRLLRLGDLADASWRRGRLRRERAVVDVRTVLGRRLAWSELRPATAEALVVQLRARSPVYPSVHG